MPSIEKTSPVTEDVEAQRNALETYCLQSLVAAAKRNALTSSLAVALGGMAFSPELAKAIAAQDADLRVYATAIANLENGKADLVRWQYAGKTTIYWGVHKSDQALGFWPVVAVVLIVTGSLVTAAWWLKDTFGAAQKIQAEATATRAKVVSDLNERAKLARTQGRVQQADLMDQALADAMSKEQAVPASFGGALQSIASNLKTGAAGAAVGGGLTLLAALYLFSQLRPRSAGSKRA